MKQLLQSLKSGETEVANVPVPDVSPGHLLIQTSHTLVSAGTERMLLEFGKADLIDKARQQPEKVRMVLEKIKTDGLQPTLEAVFNKLNQPLPLGYCNVGQVTEVGRGVTGFNVGDRVISNGKHAEVVSVPVNLCAQVPDHVSSEAAAFTVLGAVALQGIRLAEPTLGETVVVTGLGLVGLLTVQLLRAQGCRVLGLDFDTSKLALAHEFGAEVVDLSKGQDPIATAERYARGRGVDAVIVTAASSSSEPIHQAALMCRKRGRIILVGVTGLELSRDDFFEKELTFQVSASYGPGRYDPNYEEKGQDYPVGFVRWTEQRNFEAVLDMMVEGRIDVKPLISHRFMIEEAEEAYAVVAGSTPSLGILLSYPGLAITQAERTVKFTDSSPIKTGSAARQSEEAPRVSFLGAGNYATGVLIPAFKSAGARLHSVGSSAGVSGVHAGRRFGFAETTTDSDRLIAEAASDAVVITTRHDSHARFVLEALKSGKPVFVEKPLCLTLDELAEIEAACAEVQRNGKTPRIMVGFNRRFAPHVQKMNALLGAVSGPKSFVVTVNAGAIPADHWTQDVEVGGGRIVGEACHFIDLLRFLANAPIKSFSSHRMGSVPGTEITDDKASITLTFEDGSMGTVHYFANGGKAFPKERIEAFGGNGVLQLDNFKRLQGYGWQGFRGQRLLRQNKGQKACAAAFVDSVKQGLPVPIAIEEIFEVARVSIEVAEQLRG